MCGVTTDFLAPQLVPGRSWVDLVPRLSRKSVTSAHAAIGNVWIKGLPWYLVSLTSGSSAHDRDDRGDSIVPEAAPQDLPETAPQDLPENVIPLRSTTVPIVPVTSSLVPGMYAPQLAEADPRNPAHQPTPIFGRAALHLPEWPTVLVFCSLAISLLIVLLDSFRGGALAFGASIGLAFFFRLVLTDREAGMLKVRSRGMDLLTLGLFAFSITLLAFSVATTG